MVATYLNTYLVHAELISSDDLVVALDFGQFSLKTEETEPDLATELLNAAFQDGLAQRDGLVVVLSPHQNNFVMPLRVEVWSGEPGDDLLEWQEAFDVHLDISEHGLVYGSPTTDDVALPVPPGSYQALITGRGFVGQGWPGSTAPGDSWRIRVWRSDVASMPRRLKAFDDDDDENTPSEHETAGREASEQIRDDLDRVPDARDLSSMKGSVRVEHIFPFARAKVWDYLAKPQSWVTWQGDFHIDPSPGGRYLVAHDDTFPERVRDEWILGSRFDILGQWVDLQRPASVTYTWTWREPPAKNYDPDNFDYRGLARLDWLWNRPTRLGPTTVRVDLAIHRVDGIRHTRAVLTHSGIPSAWVDDLRAWWAWQLEHCERVISIN